MMGAMDLKGQRVFVLVGYTGNRSEIDGAEILGVFAKIADAEAASAQDYGTSFVEYQVVPKVIR